MMSSANALADFTATLGVPVIQQGLNVTFNVSTLGDCGPSNDGQRKRLGEASYTCTPFVSFDPPGVLYFWVVDPL